MKKGLVLVAIVCQTGLFAGWGPPITVFTQVNTATELPAAGIDSSGNSVIGYTWIQFMEAEIGATQLIGNSPENAVSFPVAPFTNGPAGTVSIAVNASGLATLLWTEYFPSAMPDPTYFLRSISLLDNMWNWSAPHELTDPDLEDTNIFYAPPGVTIDNSNNSIAVWSRRDTMTGDYNVNYALYNSGMWGMETNLSTPSSDFIPGAVVSGSPTGQAFALWPNAGPFQLEGAYFDGMSWTVPSNISSDLNTSCSVPVAVSMNSSNDALIIWNDLSQHGMSSILFSGGSYGIPQSFFVPSSVSEFVQSAAVALDSTGDGVAAWVVYNGGTFVSSIYFASYIGGSWGSPVLLDQLTEMMVAIVYPNIGVDGDGNAVIAWQRSHQNLTTAVMVASMDKGAMIAPTLLRLSTDTDDGQVPSLSVNSAGQAVVAWQNGEITGTAIQASVFGFGPTPPLSLGGGQVPNRFATQIDRVNVLRWSASADPSVVQYFVFRDGTQIGTVSANAPLTFQDHNRSTQTTLYEVTAVDASNAQSDPVSVSIQ